MSLLYNPFFRLLVLCVTAVLNWYAYVWIFTNKFHLPTPEFDATIVLISVLTHELGHAFAMRRHGLKSIVFFLVVLGGTTPLDAEKYEKLRDGKKAEILLAGMFGNVLVGCFAVLLGTDGYLTSPQVDHILNLNASLVLFNMIPIPGLDGSRFVKVLFHSLVKEWDVQLFELTAIPVLITMMVLLYMRHDVAVSIPLVVGGLYVQSRHHDTSVRGTMHRDEQIFWAIWYATLTVGAIIVFTHTGTWSR